LKSSVLNRLSLVFLFQLLNYTFSFFFTPLLSRQLNYTEFATYSQIASIAEFVSVFFGFGMGILIYKYLNDQNKRTSDVIYTFFFIAFVTSCVLAFLAFLFSGQIAHVYNNNNLAFALKIACVYVTIAIPTNIFSGVLIFYNKLRPLYITTTIINLLKFLTLYLATRVFHSFDLIFYGLTFLSLITIIIYYFSCAPFIKGGAYEPAMIKKIFSEGVPLSVNSVLGKFLFLTGGILVSQLIDGTRDFAIYRNGAFEMPLIGTIYSSISIIIFPEVARLIQSGNVNEVVAMKKRISYNTSVIVYPVYAFFIFFGSEFIRVYLSDKFAESSAIFIVFNSLLLLRINDYEDILINMGRSKINMLVYIFGAALNILLNYFFIRQYGALGGAMATPITVFIMMGILQVITCYITQKKFTDFFDLAGLLRIMGISLIIGLAVKTASTLLDRQDHDLLYLSLKSIVYFGLIAFVFYKGKLLDEQLLTFIRSKIFPSKLSP
jgi:O-antigen/teichoic acid export membrane protein